MPSRDFQPTPNYSRPPRPALRFVCRLAGITVVFIGVLVCAPKSWPQQNPSDLTDRPLEDLMNMRVTSVSKEEQKLSRTASAIFVITEEDITRSGATNIPDVLRIVPGVDVAQIDANTWGVSVRGFNQRFANKLLVLLDGRAVYTQNFGGVFWDVLDIPLEDIQRIEVIRGPGGSIWGANAVNGVINIITKKASDTKGGLLAGGAGNLDQGFGTAQYGGNLGKDTEYRVYSKYLNQYHLPDLMGQSSTDGWHLLNGGFRSDTTLSPKDNLSIQGDVYNGREGVHSQITFPVGGTVSPEADLAGGFIQGVWDHRYSDRSGSSLQVSYDA